MRMLLRAFLLLLLLLPAFGRGTAPAGFGITGNWQGKDGNWTVSPERLRLIAPGGQGEREYTVTCADPLPGDEWTLTYASVQYSHIPYAEITFSVGAPDEAFQVIVTSANSRADVRVGVIDEYFDSFGGGTVDGCGGNIHLVRITYSAKQKRCTMLLNGRPVRITDVPASLPTGPVSFRVKLPNGLDQDFCADIVDFRVQPAAVFPDANPPFTGPAWNGWQTLAKPATAEVPAELMNRMAALYGSPALTDTGRALVLASVALYERAQNGRISDGVWTAISSLTDNAKKKSDLTRKDYGFGVLYPVVAASADADQRAQARDWTTWYFKTMTSMHYRIPNQVATMRRFALLDPQRTVTAAIAQDANYSLSTALLHDVPTMAADDKMALYTSMITTDSYPFNACAWQLPDIEQVSPTYAACAKSMFSEFAAHRDPTLTNGMDIPFAYAAYRIAPTDLPLAMTLADAVRDGNTRADLYEAMQALPVGKQIPDFPARIEKALQTYIAQWRRSRTEASPVKRYLRLANWYLAQQRAEEAEAMVQEAIPKIATDDGRCRYRDLWLITTYYKTIKSPEAAAWAAKMNEAATMADTGLTDHDNGWLMIAATNSAVRALVQEDKIDEALALTEKLDVDALPENVANCYANIIYRLAKTDMPRAMELLQRVPRTPQRDAIVVGIARYLTVDQARTLLHTAEYGRQKTAILGAVAPTIANTNMAEAIALLKAMPPADRRTALFGIANITPLESNQELLTLTGECVVAYLEASKRYSSDARKDFFNSLAEQPPSTLLALEPAFAADYELYARAMVFSMAKACGLKQDPLWQRFAAAEWEYRSTPIVWGSSVFRDTVRRYLETQNPK